MTLIILQRDQSSLPINHSKGERNRDQITNDVKIKKETVNTDTMDLKKVTYYEYNTDKLKNLH